MGGWKEGERGDGGDEEGTFTTVRDGEEGSHSSHG